MKHFKKTWFVMVGLVLLSLPGWALANVADFQLNGVYPNNGVGNVATNGQVTGEVAWTPLFNAGPMGLRGEFGAWFPNNTNGNRYAVADYEAFLRFNLVSALSIEAGGGGQTFTSGNGGTAGVAGANLSFNLHNSGVDRIFAGYSHSFLSGGFEIAKAGIGIGF